VGFTIISISSSLIAVFIPIFFMPGVIGLLFHEFAVIVALSIIASAFVSLTLVPMMASRFLTDEAHKKPPGALVRFFERGFDRTLALYTRTLDAALRHRVWVLGVATATIVATGWMFYVIPKGFFPQEDIGQMQVSVEAAEDVSFEQMVQLQDRVAAIFRADPAVATVSSFNGGSGAQNTGRMFINLKPRSERPPMKDVVEGLRKKVRDVPGIAVFMRPVQNLQLGGRASKAQYQYILQSVQAGDLYDWATKVQEKMRADPMFRDVTSDAQMRGLQASLKIDRERANALGVPIEGIRSALFSAFGERQVSTIFTSVDSYQVIMEAAPSSRADESAFNGVYVRASTGALVPLTSFATVTRTVGPTAINHAGQLQAVTVSFNLAPGVALGDATARIEKLRAELRVPRVRDRHLGRRRQGVPELAGQPGGADHRRAARHLRAAGRAVRKLHPPLTILAGLPSAAVGALATLMLFNMDLTLIATIGILLLIGIVKKNAIMMIDFALDAQRHMGMTPRRPSARPASCASGPS
jgi:HAE1 family hydrophobic/amphiphilic exporter-1